MFDHAVLRRSCWLMAIVGVVELASPAIALAAVPVNDGRASAIAISGLPFSDSVDLTDATKDSDDPTCDSASLPGAPFRTVWYHYAAGPTTVRIQVDAPGRPILFVIGATTICRYNGLGNSQTFEQQLPSNVDLVFGLADDVPGTLSISVVDIVPAVANDEWQNATPTELATIADPDGVPLFSDEVVLDKATEGPDDPAVCHGTAHPLKTLWYRFRLGFDGTVALLLRTSTPDIHVGRRSGGAFRWLACARNDVDEAHLAVHARPNVWYYVLVGAGVDDAQTMSVSATVSTLGSGSQGVTPPPTSTVTEDNLRPVDSPAVPVASVVGLIAFAVLHHRRPKPRSRTR